MIKIKEFTVLSKLEMGNCQQESFALEEAVNKFIKENKITELIDIKTNKQVQEYSGLRQLYILNYVTIIYREVK